MISIVDTGGANITSLQMALQRLGADSVLTTDIQQIQKSTHVLLPGVGTAQACMKRIESLNLKSALTELKQPVLGICLGMQILFESSSEGPCPTLGLVAEKVIRIPDQKEFPVPHMGWNNLRVLKDSALTKNISEKDYFYFVHSYYGPVCTETLAAADYSVPITAIVQKNNFYGVQFHPEKSSFSGAKVLKNFLELV